MPVYNGSPVVGETLESILSQSFSDYELIVVDDCSTDNSEEVIKSYGDSRIKYFRNERNLGYTDNLEECRKRAGGEILFLMGQDDILAKDALLKTVKAFNLRQDIGAVTRPYFWFNKKIERPVRAKDQLNPFQDEIVTIGDEFGRIIAVFKSVDQFSGLALRREFLEMPFHKDVFPCHVYPFASIFKKHPIVFLKDYMVAVRIETSQTRRLSSIYDKSPLKSWAEMFEKVYDGKKFEKFRNYMIRNFVAVNYVGLVQIKNYAKFSYLLREIYYLLKFRQENIFSPLFWFFSLGTIVIPRRVLILMVDEYKNRVNFRFLKKIKFAS